MHVIISHTFYQKELLETCGGVPFKLWW